MRETVPFVIFNTRVRDEGIGGDNPYRWQEMNTDDYFGSKKVLLFSLPGAFTPTCSTMQLPKFEELYDAFMDKGFDEVYCMSVNDSYVMNAWAKSQNLKNVKVIPDGCGDFTRQMGMLVEKRPECFGMRSWRYAVVVEDKKITQWFVEPGQSDNHPSDPYTVTNPEHILDNLEGEQILV